MVLSLQRPRRSAPRFDRSSLAAAVGALLLAGCVDRELITGTEPPLGPRSGPSYAGVHAAYVTGPIVDVGIIPGEPTGANGQLFAINDQGHMAGLSHNTPAVWMGGAPYSMGVPADLSAPQVHPRGINDQGTVVGFVDHYVNGEFLRKAFRWLGGTYTLLPSVEDNK
jgi:hypothetical protein